MIFNIELLSATYGDAILIEYGKDDKLNKILIDGGTGATRHKYNSYFEALPEEERHAELVVITHVDRDHIEGLLRILEQDSIVFTIGDIWYNGWTHLKEQLENDEAFGAKQGELVSSAILKHGLKWNEQFGGHAVAIKDDGKLPEIILPGGMKLTLLSPSAGNLRELAPVWERDLLKEGLLPGFGEIVSETKDIISDDDEALGSESPNIEKLNNLPFEEDHSEANASSIAFLAEYGGKKALFLGDAEPTRIYESLKKVQPKGKIKIDICKISHHGSRGNTSPKLLELIDCTHFAISTNGSNYYHPHPETIAWIIKRSSPKSTLYFNYRSDYNKIWDSEALKLLNGYNTVYGDEGLKIKL